MSKVRIFVGLLTLCACSIAQADVPTKAALQRAFAEKCHGVRVLTLRCLGGQEEPTEAECHYSVRRNGKVLKEKSWFFVDATGWHMMDQADTGQCPGRN